MNESLREHYRKLLGLEKLWKIVSVDLAMEAQRVEIRVAHGNGGHVRCPDCDCDGEFGIHGEAPERQWRHFDTTQFETIIKARTPRANCSVCGLKTIAVLWAGKHSRFTLLFKALAIDVLKSSTSISSACRLLNLERSAADRIMSRGVDRGVASRSDEPVDKLGIDEKSSRSGHRYVSMYLGEAVNAKVKKLRSLGYTRLNGTRWRWLYSEENIKDEIWEFFEEFKNSY